MRSYQMSSKVSRYACRAVAVIVVVLMGGFPIFIELYHRYVNPLPETVQLTVIAAFYLCCPGILLALWNMDRLLKNILSEALFVMDNVVRLRRIRWCCLWVSLVCLGASFGFFVMLLFAVIMAFLALTVTVLGQVMKAGVEIREENDLTV